MTRASGRLPDLILLDGGKGQISAVERVLKKMDIDVPLFGMVKDSKHKTRAVTSLGEEIAIKANRSVYTLVSTIQEEVHRFAIGYHRQSRSKNAYVSKLTEIEGVGEARAKSFCPLQDPECYPERRQRDTHEGRHPPKTWRKIS